jgi:hypothetical protein
MPAIFLAAVLATALHPSPVDADEPEPAQARPQQSGSPDFLFSPPRGSVSIRGGWLFRSARSDWFDFVTDQLTVERSDFRAADIAGEVGIAIAPRFEVVIGADWSSKSVGSEYRDFVDNNRLPINQTTRLRQSSFTGGVRYTLMDRGRSIGTLAFLPNRFVPYVGGGAGMLWYEMLQFGDFVDVADFSVFPDTFRSRGFRPMGYANGGVDIHLYRPIYATIDGRYQWADAELNAPFIGFDPVDLGGFRLSTGLNIVF